MTWDGKSAAPVLQTLMDTAGHYRLDAAVAQVIVDEISAVVATWKDLAAKLDLLGGEVQMMANVFAV
ncbi:hypothetical protein [Variovorax sp. EBFNA2]|uniref:hypothetical protein n=1 Tax=Variovorax sp. EBFNA2 TaxID=3342097 RepID=UPI0029C07845|nr:hypothetical protein [Variovorax boronicumulans]WPG41456.1 hypothetical protein RZE79_31580 [Variovorax boronicumulans]